MTGTAMTEAEEFADIYKPRGDRDLPTHLPCVRDDQDDEVYRTADEKYEAILETDRRTARQARPAGPGRHRVDREVRRAGGDAEERA